MHDYSSNRTAPADIALVCGAIREMLGTEYTELELLQCVEQVRQRPLHVVHTAALTYPQTGLAAALDDGDLIMLRSNINAVQRLITLGHEIGHILSGHLAHSPFTTAAVAADPQTFLHYVRFRNHGIADTLLDQMEFVAEEIGIRLTTPLVQHTPIAARQLFGRIS